MLSQIQGSHKMSKVNRKILYDKLMAEGKVEEAVKVIQNYPEMAEIETKSKVKK